jgi:hypothetical protein
MAEPGSLTQLIGRRARGRWLPRDGCPQYANPDPYRNISMPPLL